ncbi:hypothetical protein EVAR_35842_1 [Eumeta japonica]|uniref:Uncharacterized protein n=1 Tax=Eumeta variegata TaxID=151549 RepID=A0A4C1WZT5_EUMVA|nr:hypothetical protein EVAR_35842_1 [Eumeta japonica]
MGGVISSEPVEFVARAQPVALRTESPMRVSGCGARVAPAAHSQSSLCACAAWQGQQCSGGGGCAAGGAGGRCPHTSRLGASHSSSAI